MDFKIPEFFSRIIKEADTRNSSDINKAIQFLINKLHKQKEFEAFKLKITKLKKSSDREKEEKRFLEYLHKEFLKQQKEYEERRKRNDERRKVEARRKEEVNAEFKKKVDLQLKFESIKEALKDYILVDLKKLFHNVNKNNVLLNKTIDEIYQTYNDIINNIKENFKNLWVSNVSDFFKRNYDFKSDSDLFKLEKLKHVLEKYNRLIKSNYDISIDLAENFLNANIKENEAREIRKKLNEPNVEINDVNEYENIILAVKIAHTVFMNYQTELNENFKELRKEFDNSRTDQMIYVTLFINNNYIDSARNYLAGENNGNNSNNENNDSGNNDSGNNGKGNNDSGNNGNGNNGKGNNGNGTFSTEIHNIRSQLTKSEARIIQEYDEEVNKLPNTQKNIFLVNEEKYDVYDFIYDLLSNDDIYLEFLESNKLNFINILSIKDINLATIYCNKLNCKINQFKNKYINYKILEVFSTIFREILDTINVIQLYNSNQDQHNIFIRLILFYNEEIEPDITLSNFLQLIACVIVFFYRGGSNNHDVDIELIIQDKITNVQEQRKAINYIGILREVLEEKDPLANEEYFKLFGRLREEPFYSKKQGESDQEKNKRKEAIIKKNADITNRLTRELHDPHHKLAVPAPLSEKSKSHSNNKSNTFTKKKKASADDKIKIIIDIFSRLLNNNFSSTGINQLQNIYVDLNRLISQYTAILSSLTLLINIRSKKADDYSRIIDIFKSLPDIINLMFQKFIVSVVVKDKKDILNDLLKKITTKINDDKLKYETEFSEKTFNQKTFNQNEEMNDEKINEHLKTLEIDKNSFNSLSDAAKIKKIIKKYHGLAQKYHPNKQNKNSTNENRLKAEENFKKILKSKESLMKFFEKNDSSPNDSGSNDNNQNNDTEYLNFEEKYLKNHPDFMPQGELSADTIMEKKQKLRDIFLKTMPQIVPKPVKPRAPKITNLMDFIVSKMNSSVSINKDTSFENAFELFNPFNELFTNDLIVVSNNNQSFLSNLNGFFILSTTHDSVLRFNSEMNDDTYMKIIFMIDILIKYIKYKLEFINHSRINDTIFSKLVYYNFFHYLNRLLLIIMNFLTSSNSRYSLFKNYQTELAKIIKNSDSSLYVINFEKNKSTPQFTSNAVSFKTFGKNEMKKIREKLISEIKIIVDSHNNQNNSNLNKKIQKLVEEIIQIKDIRFEFLKDNDEIKSRIHKFLELLKTTLHLEIETSNYSLSNLNKKKTVKEKFDFFKVNIFKKVYSKLVEKLNTFNKTNKKFKETIIEFLHIFIICFSDIFHTLQNIKSNRSEFKQLSQKINTMLGNFKKQENKKSKSRLYINGIKKHQELLEGTHTTPEQKDKLLKEKSEQLIKTYKLTEGNLNHIRKAQLLPAGVFFHHLKNSTVSTNNSMSGPKTTIIPPRNTSTYNSLTAENKIKAVKELKKKVRKGNTTLKNDIQNIANELNITKPTNITTIDEFKKKIDLIFKQKHFKLTGPQEIKLIQELSSHYITKGLTKAVRKQLLEKILSIIEEIKQDKSIKIESTNMFKHKVREIFNRSIKSLNNVQEKVQEKLESK